MFRIDGSTLSPGVGRLDPLEWSMGRIEKATGDPA
jgi:hypothetical protein